MTEGIVKYDAERSAIIESVVVTGDLSKLSSDQRVAYYRSVCQSLGLNPLTKPFDYITLNNKLTLYAKRDATDQLRKIHDVSVSITGRERADDLCVVSARASLPSGRTDESIGVVNLARLTGDALANALMKAETKAKRRVTLSIVGLGWLDETEIETAADAQPVVITEDGKITGGQPVPLPIAPSVQQPAAAASNGKQLASPEAMRRRIWELIGKAQLLSGGKRYNAFHLTAHLKKWYDGTTTIDGLTSGNLVRFGKELHQEVIELEAKAASEAQTKADALPEELPGEDDQQSYKHEMAQGELAAEQAGK